MAPWTSDSIKVYEKIKSCRVLSSQTRVRGRCQYKVTVFQPHIICVSTWLNEEVSSLCVCDCLSVSLSLFLVFPWVALSFSAWCKENATFCHMLVSLTLIFTDQTTNKIWTYRKITFNSHRNMLNHHSKAEDGREASFQWGDHGSWNQRKNRGLSTPSSLSTPLSYQILSPSLHRTLPSSVHNR